MQITALSVLLLHVESIDFSKNALRTSCLSSLPSLAMLPPCCYCSALQHTRPSVIMLHLLSTFRAVSLMGVLLFGHKHQGTLCLVGLILSLSSIVQIIHEVTSRSQCKLQMGQHCTCTHKRHATLVCYVN